MSELEEFLCGLSEDELRQKILIIAKGLDKSQRSQFLETLRNKTVANTCSHKEICETRISPEEFIAKIEDFRQSVLDGEYFDEQKDWLAMEREEYGAWNRYEDEYYDQIDFSDEPYTLEVIEMLEKAEAFFWKKDIKTALEAFQMLFEIFDDSDGLYEGCFIYGFSFEEAIGEDLYKKYKTVYFRCMYLHCVQNNDFNTIYSLLVNERKILMSDIIEMDHTPLPSLDEVVNGLIEYLNTYNGADKQLIDVLFVKGGMDEIREYAYSNGEKHPAVFLYYYQSLKEEGASEPELLRIILDGIKIIPRRYEVKSILGLDLASMAEKSNDKNNLLLGRSTAFYSSPTLNNLCYLLDLIISENIVDHREKLMRYLAGIDIQTADYDPLSEISAYRDLAVDIYSRSTLKINKQVLVLGRFILEGITPLLYLLECRECLGFSRKLKYFAIVIALTLKSISQSRKASTVDTLIAHYCYDGISDEKSILNKLISDRVNSSVDSRSELMKPLCSIEKIALKRVRHVLRNKLRGGYESACLLLVACAEVKEILGDNGNELIQNIDTEFKRFSAFRRPLKKLTGTSKYLLSV